MAIAPVSAANAYAQAAQAIGDAAKSTPKEVVPKNEGPSFGDLLEQAVDTVIETGKASEASTAQAMGGQGDVLDVVTAVAEAELTVQTVVAVRDRVIEAYQRVMQMPI